MKKILFLIPTLSHGGAERVLVNLVNGIDKSKFDIELITLFDFGVNKEYLNEDIKYSYIWKKPIKGNSILFKLIPPRLLYKTIIKEKYDIIISYLEGSTTRIISGCDDPKVKKICWVHIELNSRHLYKTGFNSFEAATSSYDKFDKIVFVSQSVKLAFEKSAGKQFPNATVIYNTNDTDRILRDSEEEITDVVFNKEEINICSVAKVIPTKGFDRLAMAHKRLIDEGIKHHIYIIGEGEQKKKIEEYLQKENIDHTFTFLGFKKNPYKYISKCDAYVCSSRREGFSTAVTEAMILGKPVVSTCCSGAYELLGQNNEFGIVVENSLEGIYEGLKKILLDSQLRIYYANASKERSKIFSKKNTIKSVENMFMEILE